MQRRPKQRKLRIEKSIGKRAFQAIGLLFAVASGAELMLAAQLIRLISTKDAAMYHAFPLVTGVEVRVKINLIRIFISMYKLDTENKSLSKMLDKLEAAFKRRNDIAHSAILPGRNKNEICLQLLRAKASAGDIPQPQFVPFAQIRQYAYDIFNWTSLLEHSLTLRGLHTTQELDVIQPQARLFEYLNNLQTHTDPPKHQRRRSKQT